jgi:DNA-binding NarL/FixJ family response regulator
LTGTGTLIVSRAEALLPAYKACLEKAGFRGVSVTSCEKDGLNRLINELKPRHLFMESCFYECATPYMMGRLLRDMPYLNITAFSIGEFPDDLAMWFYFHGVKSYVNLQDGIREIARGLKMVLAGEEYWPPKVQGRIDLRNEIPDTQTGITPRQREVLRMLCNGFKVTEIGYNLHISKRTVENHKQDMYELFHVRNESELIRIAYYLDLFKKSELCFYGGGWNIRQEARRLPERAMA